MEELIIRGAFYQFASKIEALQHFAGLNWPVGHVYTINYRQTISGC